MILEALAELARKNKSEANLFFEEYQKQRLKFFQNRITELTLLYQFSKDENTLFGASCLQRNNLQQIALALPLKSFIPSPGWRLKTK
jgi:hypothetical protein